jgi:hypothetical protein
LDDPLLVKMVRFQALVQGRSGGFDLIAAALRGGVCFRLDEYARNERSGRAHRSHMRMRLRLLSRQDVMRREAVWGPYQTVRQLVAEDRRCTTQNHLFARVEHPWIGTQLAAGSLIRERFDGPGRVAGPMVFGADTRSDLGEKLGYGKTALDDLAGREIIAGRAG